MLAKLRSEQHWHADETRWAVFVPMEGKCVFRSIVTDRFGDVTDGLLKAA